jgi:GNAT superfamily N-acetyltransferase
MVSAFAVSTGDLAELKRMTVEGFDGIAIDQRVEQQFGVLQGHDWRWRKARHIDEDIEANPTGVFVAEEDGKILGYITTRLEREAGKGRIPNLAVIPAARGKGVAVSSRACPRYRRGLSSRLKRWPTTNGNHLYPACGFIEIARQVHFARKL